MAERTLTLEDLPDLLTVSEAARATRLSEETIRRAIRAEQRKVGSGLEHVAPRGRIGKALGNTGYRVHKAKLEAWYFNLTQEAQS